MRQTLESSCTASPGLDSFSGSVRFYEATQRDASETGDGYEEFIIWFKCLPVAAVSFLAGAGSRELAVETYRARVSAE